MLNPYALHSDATSSETLYTSVEKSQMGTSKSVYKLEE